MASKQVLIIHSTNSFLSILKNYIVISIYLFYFCKTSMMIKSQKELDIMFTTLQLGRIINVSNKGP